MVMSMIVFTGEDYCCLAGIELLKRTPGCLKLLELAFPVVADGRDGVVPDGWGPFDVKPGRVGLPGNCWGIPLLFGMTGVAPGGNGGVPLFCCCCCC